MRERMGQWRERYCMEMKGPGGGTWRQWGKQEESQTKRKKLQRGRQQEEEAEGRNWGEGEDSDSRAAEGVDEEGSTSCKKGQGLAELSEATTPQEDENSSQPARHKQAVQTTGRREVAPQRRWTKTNTWQNQSRFPEQPADVQTHCRVFSITDELMVWGSIRYEPNLTTPDQCLSRWLDRRQANVAALMKLRYSNMLEQDKERCPATHRQIHCTHARSLRTAITELVLLCRKSQISHIGTMQMRLLYSTTTSFFKIATNLHLAF